MNLKEAALGIFILMAVIIVSIPVAGFLRRVGVPVNP